VPALIHEQLDLPHLSRRDEAVRSHHEQKVSATQVIEVSVKGERHDSSPQEVLIQAADSLQTPAPRRVCRVMEGVEKRHTVLRTLHKLHPRPKTITRLAVDPRISEGQQGQSDSDQCAAPSKKEGEADKERR